MNLPMTQQSARGATVSLAPDDWRRIAAAAETAVDGPRLARIIETALARSTTGPRLIIALPSDLLTVARTIALGLS